MDLNNTSICRFSIYINYSFKSNILGLISISFVLIRHNNELLFNVVSKICKSQTGVKIYKIQISVKITNSSLLLEVDLIVQQHDTL